VRGVALALALALLGAGAPVASAAARPTPVPPAPTDVLVRFAPDAGRADRGAARRAADVVREQGLPVGGLEVVDPRPGTSVRDAVAALRRAPGVLYAEPDRPRQALLVPDDPYFPYQWALRNTGEVVLGTSGPAGVDVRATEAWERTTGDPAVTVGVVDSGADLTHPDLAPNLWTNAAEAAGVPGADDDGNGYVDDLRGWDWPGDDAVPADENGHGTHVAGIVGARGGDGAGVAGTAWSSTLLPLRVLDADGTGYVSDLVEAYAYAARAGVRVLNASLGGDAPSQAERDALAAAAGVLVVTAAGNTATDNDATPTYPCAYDLPNVVCVAASDRRDALAGFSSFGAEAVDLAAPGVAIVSTWTGGRHALMEGSSMAAPFVSGAAALALALRPELEPAALRGLLVATARPAGALAGRVASGGRLDVAGLLDAVAGQAAESEPEPVPPPGEQPAPGPGAPRPPAADPAPAPPAR
jgi:subtilisin family serine protease